MKTKMNFTFDQSTAERLRQYAFENHQTMSQALTELIWKANVSYSQLRGQLSFDLGDGRNTGRTSHRKGAKNGMPGSIISVQEDSVIARTDKGTVLQVEPLTRKVCTYFLIKGRFTKVQVASYRQYPFILSYSMTIHRAQGQTLNSIIVCPDTFSPAQLYVALSRVRSFEGLCLTRPIRAEDIKVDPAVVAFYERIEKMAGISEKKGRPAVNTDGSRRDAMIWGPKALEAHVREEIRLNRTFPMGKAIAPVHGRVHMRVPEALSKAIKAEIDVWKNENRARRSADR